MEKEIITMAGQELANRIEKRNHFLKDIEQILNWNPINKVLSKVEIRRTSVAGRDAFSAVFDASRIDNLRGLERL